MGIFMSSSTSCAPDSLAILGGMLQQRAASSMHRAQKKGKRMDAMTRKEFCILQGAAAAAGAAMLGAATASASDAVPDRKGAYTAGTYTDTQDTGYAFVDVVCTFDNLGLTDLVYEVTESTANDYFAPFAEALTAYCASVAEAGTPEGIDSVAGASLCCKAIIDGYENCLYQALGIDKKAGPDFTNRIAQDYSIFAPATTDLSHVFSPLQIGPMILKNRTAKACAGSVTWVTEPDEILQPSALDYYGTMAENGVSLIVIGMGAKVLNGVFDRPVEEVAEAAKPLVDRVHAAGSYIGMQLAVGGGMGDGANEMASEDIEAAIVEMGERARILQQIGFDFVEVKGASSDTLNAFFSRRANHREDEYGSQSLENRTRFYGDLIASVREHCGPEFPIVALINAMEICTVPVGADSGHITIEEGKQLAKFLEDAGVLMIQVRVLPASVRSRQA